MVNKIKLKGRCDSTATNERRCICNSGWSGKYCQIEICHERYCLNGGIFS